MPTRTPRPAACRNRPPGRVDPCADPAPPCPVCGGLQCLCRPRFFPGQLLSDDDLNRLAAVRDRQEQAAQPLPDRLGRGLRAGGRVQPVRSERRHGACRLRALAVRRRHRAVRRPVGRRLRADPELPAGEPGRLRSAVQRAAVDLHAGRRTLGARGLLRRAADARHHRADGRRRQRREARLSLRRIVVRLQLWLRRRHGQRWLRLRRIGRQRLQLWREVERLPAGSAAPQPAAAMRADTDLRGLPLHCVPRPGAAHRPDRPVAGQQRAGHRRTRRSAAAAT